MSRPFLSAALLLAAATSVPAQSGVTRLHWAGPPGTRPGTYREWHEQHPGAALKYHLNQVAPGTDSAGTIAVLTEQGLYPALAPGLNQLVANLQADGYTVLSYTVAGGTPESLRAFLRDRYLNAGLEGALFIGDLPVAWYQIRNDFGDGSYAEWPIDLYYMDLDGEWLDTVRYDPVDTLVPGQDSVFDGHRGNVTPEIYIGRLTPTGIGDDTLLLKAYLQKDNAFRLDTLFLPPRALVFVDDDWYSWAATWAADVSLLFPDTLNFFDPETTRCTVYRNKLGTPQNWVALFSHSWPGGHCMYYNDRRNLDYYYATTYTTQRPPANFYNHFACSFSRYTDNGYGGGRSIFYPGYGLGEVGSTKTGSMLQFSHFYGPLADGRNLGEAFRDWFDFITRDTVTIDELSWHYGMTLLGDPFLQPNRLVDATVMRIVAPRGTVDSGVMVTPQAWVRNLGVGPASLQLELRIGASYHTVGVVNDIPPGDSVLAEFAAWTPMLTGTFAVFCSTDLSDERYPRNDRKIDSVVVAGTAVQEPAPATRSEFGLWTLGANPFRGQVSFEVAADGLRLASLDICDAQGRALRRVPVPLNRAPGRQRLVWDGRDERGCPVPPGIYYCRLRSGDRTAMQKLVRLER